MLPYRSSPKRCRSRRDCTVAYRTGRPVSRLVESTYSTVETDPVLPIALIAVSHDRPDTTTTSQQVRHLPQNVSKTASNDAGTTSSITTGAFQLLAMFSSCQICKVLFVGIIINYVLLGSSSAASSLTTPLTTSTVQQSGFSEVFKTIARYWLTRFDARSSVPAILSLATAGDGDPDQGVLSLRRSLVAGDFDELNLLLKEITVQAPDTTVKQKILWNDLSLDLKNIRCYDISVEDVQISFEQTSSQKISVPIDILGLDMWCELDWRYSWGIFNGDGSAQMYTDNNSAKTVLSFTSEDFALHAPNGSGVESCSPRILITDINIQGNFVAQVVNFAEKSIRGTVADKIKDVVCEELGTLGSTAVSDVIEMVDGLIEGYKKPLEPYLADPLGPEQNLVMPQSFDLMDLTDTENSVGGWFNTALSEVDKMLGSTTEDASSPTGTSRDLGVNKILRSTILDENRAFVVPVASWPASAINGGVIFQGHDMLTETTIILKEIRLKGIDTFKVFDPLNTIGSYTLGNKFQLDHLSFEADLSIQMLPSSHSSAVIVSPNAANKPKPQIENITIKSGVQNLIVDLSFFLALNQDALGDVQLGAMLSLAQIPSCLLGAIHKAKVSGLSVVVDDIEDVSVTGFISPGIDRILRTAAELAFKMYKAPMLDAMPNFFQIKVREIMNDFLAKQIDSEKKARTCQQDANNRGLLDFRDLFLSSDEAARLGASGNSPYGDVGPILMNLLKDQVLSNEENGSSRINSLVVRPLTKAQFGTEGLIRHKGDVFGIKTGIVDDLLWSSFVESFELRLFDARIENIDTVQNPVLLKASESSAIELKNSVEMGLEDSIFGDVPRPLKGSIRTLIEVGGDTPLAMRNDLDLRVEVPSMEVVANLFVPISEKPFMEFPLESLLNMNCWFATIDTPVLNDEGLRVEKSKADISLAISNLIITVFSMRLDTSCVSCTTEGFNVLSEVIDVIEGVGTIDEIKNRLVRSTDELLEGEWAQSQIDRYLVDSKRKCPHHPLYRTGAQSMDWPSLEFPPISKEALELILLSGATMLQAGIVVVAESHSKGSIDDADPLSGQKMLEVPSNVHLLDFSDLNTSLGALGGLADSALSQVQNRFGNAVNDPAGPNGEEDLYANVILRDVVLDEERALSIPFGELGLDTAGLSIAITSINIRGLDTITRLDILEPIGRQTLMNKVSFKYLDLEIHLSITDKGRMLEQGDGEEIVMTMGLESIDADIALLIAMDLNLFGNLELGSMLYLGKILPCVLSASRAVEFSQLLLQVGDIKEPEITGFISSDAEESIRSTTRAIFDKYREIILNSVPSFFDQTVRPLVNDILSNYVEAESSRSCPSVSSPELNGFVNFHDLLLSEREAAMSGGRGTSPYGDLLRRAMNMINDQFLAVDGDGLSRINNVVFGPMTEAQSSVPGSLLYPGDIFGGASNVNIGGFKATVEVRAFDAAIEHINTVGEPLKLLDPVQYEPNVLDNTATFGVGKDPLRASVGFLISIMGEDDDLSMRNEIVVSADLSAATVVASALVQMKEHSFLTFPLRDTLNLNCWLATMPAASLNKYGVRSIGSKAPSLALQKLAVTMSRLQLNVECISCTSPGFEELAQMLSSAEGIEDTTLIANKVSNYVTSLLGGELVETKIDRLLYNAAKQCPHHPAYDPNFEEPMYEALEVSDRTVAPLNFLVALLIVGSVLFVVIALVAIVVKCIVRRRHRQWVKTLEQDEIITIYEKQSRELQIEKDLSRSTKSLATSPAVPLYVRIGMPLVIIVNIGLFLSGHLSLGATVTIKASIAGEELLVGEFFKFSMAYSVSEMWAAGAKSLAVLILIFSGVWPYTKQLVTLVLWFLPTRWCSTVRRGKIFLWLDCMGKWSMVDVFVLLCTLAAFRISIESPTGLAFLPDGFYSIDLMVIPLWGLYSNMTAQLLSQISSHFIIHFHRRVVASGSSPLLSDSDGLRGEDNKDVDHLANASASIASIDSCAKQKQQRQHLSALCQHKYRTDYHRHGPLGIVRPLTSKVIILGAIAVTALIIAGCTMNSFSLDIMGIVGIAVESGQGFSQAKTYHNLFSLAGVILEQARFLDTGRYYLGLGTLACLLIATTLFVPILQVWVLVRQWLAPLSQRGRRRVHIAIECLAAWQYVEVYIISLIITSWQIGSVSDYMVNAYCGDLSTTLSSMAYYGVIDPTDAQCFRVEAQVEEGMYVLIVGAIILGLINHLITKAAQQRDEEETKIQRLLAATDADNESGLLQVRLQPQDSMRSSQSSEDAFTDQDEKVIDKSARIIPVDVRFTDTYRFLLQIQGDTNSNDDDHKEENGEYLPTAPPQDADTNSSPATPPRATLLKVQRRDHATAIESSEEDIEIVGGASRKDDIIV